MPHNATRLGTSLGSCPLWVHQSFDHPAQIHPTVTPVVNIRGAAGGSNIPPLPRKLPYMTLAQENSNIACGKLTTAVTWSVSVNKNHQC